MFWISNIFKLKPVDLDYLKTITREFIRNFHRNLPTYIEKFKIFLTENLKIVEKQFLKVYNQIPPFKYKDYVIAGVLILISFLIVFIFVRVVRNVFKIDHLKKGDRLLKKGKFERARKHFIKVHAYSKTAFCSLKLTRIEEAAEYFMLAKEFEMAAKYYALDGKYKRAAEIYEKIGKKIEVAEMLFKAGEYENSAKKYRELNLLKKAEEMYVKNDQFLEIATMYKDNFDREKAELPKSPPPKKIENIKALALKSGQYFNRIGEYKQAADIFIRSDLIREAALAYSKAEEYEKAANLCIQIDDREKAAQFYVLGGIYERAIDIYTQLKKFEDVADVLEKSGKRAEAAELRGKLSLEKKDTELAARHLEEAGKFVDSAELYSGIKKYAKAAELYEKGEQFEKAAELYEKTKEMGKAAELYKRVSRFRSAAMCYREMNDERSYIENLLLGECYLEAAKFYLDKSEEDRAIEVLQKVDTDSPDYRMACNMLGRIFKTKNVLGLAREKLSKAVEGKEMDKRNLDMFYDLAVFKEGIGEESDALKIYEKILSFDYYYKDVQDRRSIIEKKFSPRPVKGIESGEGMLSERGKTTGSEFKNKVINNRYEIMEEIGRGGMGVVYKGYDRSLDRIVALKFLPSDLIRDTKDVEKFINEAKSAAKLNHRNIITIHDIDQVEGDYFIVMEFVDGANLKEIIDLAKNLPFKTIHLISIQICDALSYAHKNGVIHRDIKNANIMWTNEKMVKIADFGLAKIISDGLKTSTRVQGSPVYMSPEQVLGKDIDHRTDIYSFGVSLYEMATGKVPFERGDIGYHHLNTVPEPPEAIRTDMPEYLSKIIKKCLSKRPEDRYQNTAEIMEEFQKSEP